MIILSLSNIITGKDIWEQKPTLSAWLSNPTVSEFCDPFYMTFKFITFPPIPLRHPKISKFY